MLMQSHILKPTSFPESLTLGTTQLSSFCLGPARVSVIDYHSSYLEISVSVGTLAGAEHIKSNLI